MGADTASISRDIYDENLRYLYHKLQEGVSWVDADENDGRTGLFNFTRRIVQIFVGDGSPDDGFKVVGTGATNSFTIKGGDDTGLGAGRFYLKGFPGLLFGDTTYSNLVADEDDRSIHPVVTGLTATGLTDSAANYAVNELTGQELNPDITQGTTFTITSNTATTITTAGDMTTVATALDRYRVNLSTPSGGDRTDAVYVNMYIDEIDSTDDTNLKHNLGGLVEAQLRFGLIQTIFVREADASPFTDYADSDGKQHRVFRIATIRRLDADATITAAMVQDLRPIIGSLSSITASGGLSLRDLDALRPHEADPPDNTVVVEAGTYVKSDGSASVTFAGGVSPTFGTVGADSRIDLLTIDDAGTLAVTVGVQSASPTAPTYPAAKLVIAEVTIDETTTVVIFDADIRDVRPFLNLGAGGGGVTDHGALTGLADDDHTQYSLVDGTRAFTGKVAGLSTAGGDPGTTLATKDYVDGEVAGVTTGIPFAVLYAHMGA